MARILCLETATHLCSVALCDDTRVLASRDEEEGDRFTHAERLNTLVDEVMKEGGTAWRELDAVAVGIGPGSYTGLRIGLSSAKGFCYALGIPIIGIGTLDTLVSTFRATSDLVTSSEVEKRHPASNTSTLHPMIDARRMEVFTSDPIRPLILSDEWIRSLDTTRQHMVFGDGADKAEGLWKTHAHVVHVTGVKPHASAMIDLAAERFARKSFDDLAYLVPHYGKEANVTATKKG